MLGLILAGFAVLYVSLFVVKMIITWNDFRIMAWADIEANPDDIPRGADVEAYARTLQVVGWLAAGFNLIYLLPVVVLRERWNFFKPYDPITVVKHALSKGE